MNENDSVSSSEEIIEKKLYPVLNENNIFIQKEDIQKILKKGGINKKINDIQLYQTAFIHKSYCNNNDIKKQKLYGSLEEVSFSSNVPIQENSNEVMEWIGDGVIQNIISSYLPERFSDQKEGFLTKLRSKLVKTDTLSKLALKLNFDKFIIISKHIEIVCNGRNNLRILEDAFEAFIGAMMNDFGKKNKGIGYVVCYDFLIKLIEDNIDITELILNNDNYKDILMQYFQKNFNGKFPIYEQKTVTNTVNEHGITHKKFHMCVRDCNHHIIGEGIARSKKEAEQIAAKEALHYFGKDIFMLE